MRDRNHGFLPGVLWWTAAPPRLEYRETFCGAHRAHFVPNQHI
ncbi:hypothetical protein AX27061_0465 [Achromobacter xylosoxidans NBRC 15126 = ATCC 27061]|nr:hypothetical protein AX27061_0465 [Achromobacter xylosoxidans NBRC 15126 = ATCC 27061]